MAVDEKRLERQKELGANILKYRKEAKLARNEVAQKLNVTSASLGQWERGERLPLLDNLFKLAELLKVDVVDLIKSPTTEQNAVFEYRFARAKEIAENLFDCKKAQFEGLSSIFFPSSEDEKILMEIPAPVESETQARPKSVAMFLDRAEFVKLIETAVNNAIQNDTPVAKSLQSLFSW